jgi:protoporphyrinogen oxidase
MNEGDSDNRVIILGAGVTGLSAGIRLLDSGYDVSILEKANHPGGLARTVVRGNYRLDIGPHHLFSQNETILKEILDLFESHELVSTTRDAKMYFHDRILNYPLTAKTVLLDMGLKHSFFGATSYAWMVLRRLLIRKQEKGNFQELVSHSFGNYMYNIFFKPYTEQFWGLPCEELSPDCVPQLTKMSFLKILKMIFHQTARRKNLSTAERESMLTLFYPKKGIGAIVEKMHDVFLAKGGVIELNSSVSELIINANNTFTVHYQNETERAQNEIKYVVSSIPIPSLVKVLRPAPPDAVLQSAQSLEYLSSVILYIVTDGRDFMDCSYLYMINRPYNRVSNTNRFHHELSPEGENMLAVEITCHFNDATWKSTEDEIFDKCIKDLEADGLVNRSEIKQFFTLRIKRAYPLLRLSYRKNLADVFNYFKKVPSIKLAGRTGAFKYKDIDQCMEETAHLVKQLKIDHTI